MGLESILTYIAEGYQITGLIILFFSAMIEYLFPPFPGDTVTLAGAVLVSFGDWNFFLVYGAVTLGSLAGSALMFFLGIYLYRWQQRRGKKGLEEKLNTVIDKFKKHGAVYLVLNRFLPGVRSFFFIAAGMAGITFGRVMFFSFISLLLWNALLMAAGVVLGHNVPRIEQFFKTYSFAVWVLITGVILFFVIKYLRSRRSKSDSKEEKE